MRFNTNHDKNAYDGPAVEKYTPLGAKATAVLTFTYPGIPLIYNGEEAGNTKRLELFEKIDIDWSNHVECRTFYETLASLRSQHPALVSGSYSAVQNSEDRNVLSFFRIKGKDSVLVVINFSSAAVKAEQKLPAASKSKWKNLFSNTNVLMTIKPLELQLSPFEFAIFSPLTEE
jgi:glycosidase